MKTAQQAAQNWANSSGRAQAAYQTGVETFSGDWAGATTSQEAALLTNVTQAITSGAWRNGVSRVGTQGWKSATVAKIGNYGTGFAAGAAKQASAIGKILQAEASIVPALPARGSFEQNVQRSVAFQTAMHQLKGQLKG